MDIIVLISLPILAAIVYFFKHNAPLVQSSELENLYSSALSDMNVDFSSDNISPKNIENIGKSVNAFQKKMEKFYEKYSYYTEPEKSNFLKIIEDFHKDLELWMKRHQTELEKYIETIEIEAEKAQAREWKNALELAIARLVVVKNQINEL